MFKAITLVNKEYHLFDTEFHTRLPIPYTYILFSGGATQCLLHHNNAYVKRVPDLISRALALTLEYQRRNTDVAKNLALYYLSLGEDVPELTRNLAHAKLWFNQYCPELGFYDLSKCISNKINQYKWINPITS